MMKDSDTTEKQVDAILETRNIKRKEQLFHVEFYAFLNAYVRFYLPIQHK